MLHSYKKVRELRFVFRKKRTAEAQKDQIPVPLCFFLQLVMKQAVFIYHVIIQYLMAVIISETEINTFGLMTVKMETLFGGV